MDRQNSQENFKASYSKTGTTTRKPSIDQVTENKHGVDNPVVDLDTGPGFIIMSVGAGLSFNPTTGVLNNTITQYTDELAQDAIGAEIDASLTYVDATPSLGVTAAYRKKSLFNHFADAGNTTTGETDLYSDTIAAGQLAVNGEKLEADYGGVFVSSGTATRELKVYFGGTVVFDTGALTLSLSSAWVIRTMVMRVSATVVRCITTMTTEGSALAAYTQYGEVTGLTLSGTNIMKITGQAGGVGAATNDIVAKVGNIMWNAAA